MHRGIHISGVFLAFSLCILTGCAAGPDYARPETSAQAVEAWLNAPEDHVSKGTPNHWWKRIKDPLLDEYVEQLFTQNLQLVEATERTLQARAWAMSQTGRFFPSVNLDVSVSRSGSPNVILGNRLYNSQLNPGLNVSWEPDLFGRIRRSVEAQTANYHASVYDREALKQSLVASLVSLRVEIAVTQRLLKLARQSAKNRKRLYEDVKKRYELGVAGTAPQNALQAEQNWARAQSDVHGFQRQLTDAVYRLDALLGQPPGTTNPLKKSFPLLMPKMDVPVCLPADLLDRRPDLRAAELRLKASNADIGVAIADLYPALTFSGSGGFLTFNDTDVFRADRIAWSLLGSLTTRLFEGGALRANIDLQESEARELAASYADDVLNALREVETHLQSEKELAGSLQSDTRSVEALRKADKVMRKRYDRGVERLQDYLEIQSNLYIAEQTVLQTQRTYWDTRISLYLALGGDWFSDQKHALCSKGKDHGAS